MPNNFLRKYRLEFGRPYKQEFISQYRFSNYLDDPNFIQKQQAAQGLTTFQDEGQKVTVKGSQAGLSLLDTPQSLVIEELQITFDIDKAASSTLDSCKIVLMNISNESREFLASYRDESIYVDLQAGYEDDMKTLFRGMVRNVSEEREGHISRTTVALQDGYTNVREAYSSFTVFPSSSAFVVFEKLLQDIGLPAGRYVRPTRLLPPEPYICHGKTKDCFKKLADDIDYIFSIQDAAVDFLPKDSQATVKNVYIVSPETGLIGSPKLLSNSSGKLQAAKREPSSGISFKALLNGGLKTNDIIRVESREFSGFYRIQKVKHTGDFRGDTWFTEVEAAGLSPFLIEEEFISRDVDYEGEPDTLVSGANTILE